MGVFAGPEIVEDGLVLALDAGNTKSYPGSGTTWTDLSGNGNNGSLENGVGFDGSNGGSLSFDGVDDYVTTGTKTIVYNGGTVSIWAKVKFGVNYGQGLFNGSSYPTYLNFYILPNSSTLRWEVISNLNVITGTVSISSGTLISDTWYNFVGTFDGGTSLKLYVNGVLGNSTNSGTTQPTSITAPIEIGRYAGYANGNIAQASIYNRALTAAEVSQNFNALRGRYGI